MKTIEHIVVGAGITGLYTAYKLNSSNVMIIDKSTYIGGRVHTNTKEGYTYECGAGRIGLKQKLIMELLEELDLKNKLSCIKKSKHFYVNNNFLKNEEELLKFYDITRFKSIKEIWEKAFSNKSQYKKEYLKEINLVSYLNLFLLPNEVEVITKSFGFTSKIYLMNAYESLDNIQADYDVEKSDFYVLQGGLKQIIDKLVDILKTRGVEIMLNSECIDVKEYNNSSKKIKISQLINNNLKNKIFVGKKVYFTIPKDFLIKIPYFSNNLMINSAVTSYPLMRIYAKYPLDKDGKSWFENISTTYTDLPIRTIIPLYKGLIMISYTDNYYANFWNNLSSKKEIEKYLLKYLKLVYKDVEIPKIEWLSLHYWHHANHVWNIGYDYESFYKNIKRTFHSKGIYILGESFAKHQSWIDGCLEQVNEQVF